MRYFFIGLFFFGSTSSLFGQLEDAIKFYESLNEGVEEFWPMHTTENLAKEMGGLKQLSRMLTNTDESNLSTQDIINKDLLELLVEDQLFHLNFKSHTFPLNAEGGFLADMVYSIRGTLIQTEEDYENYLIKLNAITDYFDQRILQMREGQENGKSSPKLIIQNCITLIDLLLKTSPEETYFSQVGTTKKQREEISSTVLIEVYPAYETLREFLVTEYLPNAPEEIGISNIADGESYYEQRVKYFTTFDISPEEVYQTGLEEVARIRAEMEAIITQLGFEGSFAEFLEFLRTDPQFYCTDGQDLLFHAAWITTKSQGQLPKFFGLLPRVPLDVVAVPDALAPTYTTGRYSPGNDAIQKAGQYWVNTYQLESRPLYVLPALTLHEGVPGHHLQIMLAAEIEDLPDFRKQTYLSAFGEGWGLYAEHLGQEMGIYTNLYEQFGRLTYEMWRACRLVVDPGMHYMGWSREKAFDYMASNTALSIHEVNTEIDRYIGWPGQAVSYKMGELKIKELRAKAESELGDKFDIRAFHDVLLANGSVPLETLERIVDNYIQESR